MKCLPGLVNPFHLHMWEKTFNSCHVKFANCAHPRLINKTPRKTRQSFWDLN